MKHLKLVFTCSGQRKEGPREQRLTFLSLLFLFGQFVLSGFLTVRSERKNTLYLVSHGYIFIHYSKVKQVEFQWCVGRHISLSGVREGAAM